MMRWLSMVVAVSGLALTCAALPAQADQIAVANYGSAVSSMPWAIAMQNGYFKDEGLDITGIIGSGGGSNDVRNLIAGKLLFADSSLVPVLRAIQSGANLKIIDESTHTTTEFVWLVKPDSPLKSINDIKGTRISFTTPLSTSQALDFMLLKKMGLTTNDVHLVSAGSLGASLTALQSGGVDIALVGEPAYTLNKNRFRVLIWSRDVFPAMSSSVGVTSDDVTKNHPDTLRKIILAYRRAVLYMQANRSQSAQIIGKQFRLDPAVVLQVLNELMDHPSTDGVYYFSEGNINPHGVDTLISAASMSGALKGNIDWRQDVDQSFLPPDLRRDLNQ
jgi:NitT/TauT family transport system substrate-binding protein